MNKMQALYDLAFPHLPNTYEFSESDYAAANPSNEAMDACVQNAKPGMQDAVVSRVNEFAELRLG